MTAVVIWLNTEAGKQQLKIKQGGPSSESSGAWRWWPFSSTRAAPREDGRCSMPNLPPQQLAQASQQLAQGSQLSFVSSHPASGTFETPTQNSERGS